MSRRGRTRDDAWDEVVEGRRSRPDLLDVVRAGWVSGPCGARGGGGGAGSTGGVDSVSPEASVR